MALTQLFISVFRWVGKTTTLLLKGCKPVQKAELEKEFEKLKAGKKARPDRLLRSQQQSRPEVDHDAAGRVVSFVQPKSF